MSARIRIASFVQPHDDVLAAWQPFADFAAEEGFSLMVEWRDPWVDEGDGTEYPGRFAWAIYREGRGSDGRLHAYFLDVGVHPTNWPEAWQGMIELAQAGFDDYCRSAGVELEAIA